ncbi:U-box domain-containing protein [Aphelenchoides avenae]|nr:U-box domain-containing protein [Aphelenchus avenae]
MAAVHPACVYVERILGMEESSSGLAHELRSIPGRVAGYRDIMEAALGDDVVGSTDEFAGFADELLSQLVIDMKPQEEAMETGQENPTSLGSIFRYPPFDRVPQKPSLVLSYHIGCVRRFVDVKLPRDVPQRLVTTLRERILVSLVLFLRAHTASGASTELITDTLTQFVMLDANHWIIDELVRTCANTQLSDPEALAEVFNPVLERLRYCVSRVTVADRPAAMLVEDIYRLLNRLLNIKVDNVRPIADLVASRRDFVPTLRTELQGREIARLCFFGPFFNMSVANNEGEQLHYSFTSRYPTDADVPSDDGRFAYYAEYQGRMNTYRRELHGILFAMLSNASTRDRTLHFIAEMVRWNRKRSQMQADQTKLATDGFMLNFFCVLLKLSEKITLDKVAPLYIFHPKSRIDLKDETRLKFNSEELQKFVEEQNLAFDPNFPTESA